jgi:hypothetical protein
MSAQRAVGEIFQGGLGTVAVFTKETGGKTGMILYALVYMMRNQSEPELRSF